MKVTLLTHTPDPQRYVAAAAKLCYSKASAEELAENLSDEEIESFIGLLISLHHESPLEHVSFTFAVDGVSRALTHQLVRHRIASYSQQSQRYVKLEQFEFIVPPHIANDERAVKIFEDAMARDQETYDKLVDILYEKHFSEMINDGLTEEKAEAQAMKIAIEDARYVFPNACETKIVITMNARTLLNFFSKRCCERAQWEIRNMSILMLEKVKQIAPIIFKNAGPSCVSGNCTEGSMTCGRMIEIREKFRTMEMKYGKEQSKQ